LINPLAQLDINAVVNRISDDGGSCLYTQKINLFDREQIRDTSSRYPEKALNLRGAEYWTIEVDNRHNQTVLVEMISGAGRPPAAMGLSGPSNSIAASTFEPIHIEVWGPEISIRVSYGTSPTTGHLTVDGFIQKWVRLR